MNCGEHCRPPEPFFSSAFCFLCLSAICFSKDFNSSFVLVEPCKIKLIPKCEAMRFLNVKKKNVLPNPLLRERKFSRCLIAFPESCQNKKIWSQKTVRGWKALFPAFSGTTEGGGVWLGDSRTSCDGPPPFSLLAALLFRESPHQVNRVLDPGQLRFTICRFFLFRQAFFKEEK